MLTNLFKPKESFIKKILKDFVKQTKDLPYWLTDDQLVTIYLNQKSKNNQNG